jgi:Uma2 family endonuclease
MAVAPPKSRHTPEDLLTLKDGRLYELVDEELVEKETGGRASWIGGELFRRLSNHVVDHDLGRALPADASYQCFHEHATRVRLPDASFIAAGRLPGDQLPEGHITIAPDLAAEVVSPNDLYYDVHEKAEEYRRAGVRLVWIVDPGNGCIDVLRLNGSTDRRRAGDELLGEDVLPGFRCAVSALIGQP